MNREAITLHRKAITAVGSGGVAVACAGLLVSGAFAAPSSAPARTTVSPILKQHFSVFARTNKPGTVRPRSVADPHSAAAQYPALQDLLDTMMQPDDPSAHLQLSFSDAVVETTQSGPAVLVPGALGACMLLQIPGAGGQPKATATCDTTPNIIAYGGVTGIEEQPATGYSVVYGLADNGELSADVISSSRHPSGFRIYGNAYAFNTSNARRVVLHRDHGQGTEVIKVPKLPRRRLIGN